MNLCFVDNCFTSYNDKVTNHIQEPTGKIIEARVPVEMKVISQKELMMLISNIFSDINFVKLMRNTKHNTRTAWIIIGTLQLEHDIPVEISIKALKEYLSQNGYPVLYGVDI